MNHSYNVIITLSICAFTTQGFAQDNSLYQKKWLVQQGDTLPYRVLLPLNFDSSKPYPVIFFLHGAGERGTTMPGIPLLLRLNFCLGYFQTQESSTKHHYVVGF